VAIRLKRTWRDGTTHLVFEPLELLAKLAALTPRPEVNLLLYHGLLAPHARGRAQVVRYGRPAPDAGAADTATASPPAPRNWPWAALMRQAFALDVLACPPCGGRMRVITTVADPAAIGQILAARHPGQPRGPDPPAPAGAPGAIH
jgi:hypothetical protein